MFKSKLAQLAHPPPPPLFPSNPQPNPSTQPPSPNIPNSNSNHHTCKAIFLRSGTSYLAPVEAVEDDFGEGPSRGNDLHVDVEHRDDFEERGEKKVFKEGEKKNKEVEEKKDEVEEETEKKNLDEEEKWKRIQERRRCERLHAPALPFSYKAVEKQLQDKFLKFLEHIRKLEMKIPFLEAMEQMPQYAK